MTSNLKTVTSKKEKFMGIESNKTLLIDWIKGLKDETVIEGLITLKKTFETDWWDDLDPKAQESVLKGLSQLDKGMSVPHEEVMKLIKEKFNV